MILKHVERGIAAGSLAGLAYGLYVAAVANPFILRLEELAEHGHEHGHEHAPVVSEATTALVSVGGGVLWGILLGGAFGLAYYFLEPTLPGTRTVRAYVLAGAGFLTMSAVPWLVMPPAIPGVESAYGTDVRLVAYAGLMLLGALVAASSVLGYRKTRRHGRERLLAVAVAAVPLVVVALVLPAVTPTVVGGGEIPGELVAAFRGMVALSNVALWAIIAGSYAWLQDRTGENDEPTRDSAVNTGTETNRDAAIR